MVSQRTLLRYSKDLKKAATKEELIFKEKLDYANIEYIFQMPFEKYILDFYLPKTLTVIEIDGGYHQSDKQKRYDKRRDNFCKSKGLQVIRIKNEDVYGFNVDKMELIPGREITRKSPKAKKMTFKKIVNQRIKKTNQIIRSKYHGLNFDDMEVFHKEIATFIHTWKRI